jgi:hypothetical protein
MAELTEAGVESERPIIVFTHPKVKQLQAAYDAAVRDEREEFTFEGQALLTVYAKYLLQYLWGRFDGTEER